MIRKVPIVIDFSPTIDEIGYIFNATGDQGIVKVTNGIIRLIQNRTYYLPIKKYSLDIDTDMPNINVKTYSSYADKIDIKFVKEGYVALTCLINNVILRTGETIGYATIDDHVKSEEHVAPQEEEEYENNQQQEEYVNAASA